MSGAAPCILAAHWSWAAQVLPGGLQLCWGEWGGSWEPAGGWGAAAGQGSRVHAAPCGCRVRAGLLSTLLSYVPKHWPAPPSLVKAVGCSWLLSGPVYFDSSLQRRRQLLISGCISSLPPSPSLARSPCRGAGEQGFPRL